MTYLQLVNRLKQECDVSGSNLTTVESQTGELLRLVNWIEQAWLEIQLMRDDWEFRRGDFSFQTVSGTSTYSTSTVITAGDFAKWKADSFRIFLTSAGQGGETHLTHFQDYNTFRDLYLYGSRITSTGRPNSIAINPAKALVLGLVPDSIYTVSGEYFSTPFVMGDEDDPSSASPDMPARFHLAIVAKALEYYGLFEAAGEIIAKSERMFSTYYNPLRSDQAQGISIQYGY